MQGTWWQISGIIRGGLILVEVLVTISVGEAKRWGILGEILVVIGAHDGQAWVSQSQTFCITLTVDAGVVIGATVDNEVGRLVDECSSLGVGTGGWGPPEATAEVDPPELVGI